MERSASADALSETKPFVGPDPVPEVDPSRPHPAPAFEVEIEPILADVRDTVELAMAALERDFAIQLEPIGEELSLRLQALEEALDPEFETLTYETTLMAAELAEQASHLAETAAPTEEQMEALQLEARRLAETEFPLEEIEKLQERARGLAEKARPSREELDRLREQARELADSFSMDEESLTEMQNRARALAERARPSREQLEQLHERIRETVEEWHAERLRELETQVERDNTEPRE